MVVSLKLSFYMFYSNFPVGQYSMIYQSLPIIAATIEDTMPVRSSMKLASLLVLAKIFCSRYETCTKWQATKWPVTTSNAVSDTQSGQKSLLYVI